MVPQQESDQRPYFELQLGDRLELISIQPRRLLPGDNNQETFATVTPIIYGDEKDNNSSGGLKLCVIFAWFAANRKHLLKFAQLYLDHDFDVILAKNTPAQVRDPVGNAKTGGRKLLKFLSQNQHYDTIVIHGFSIGALWWGQTLCYIDRNPDLYGFLHDKIKGQVWDSPFTDKDHLPYVGGSTVFPHNPGLQKMLEAYLKFHMKTFKMPGSEPYNHIFGAFKSLNFNVPYLLYASEDDSTALCSTVAGCADQWKRNGNTVYWKIWSSSVHVCHMKEHPEEYKALLWNFLRKINVIH